MPLCLIALVAWAALAVPGYAGITECDRQASHPSDPDKVLPGVNRADMDLERAEAACRKAVADDPRSARAAYLLGRVLFYGNRTAEALSMLERASAAGYRQATFVLGYVHYQGTQAPRNDCRAAQLWQRSIALEHPWTGYYLVNAYLDGRFAACGFKLSDADLERYAALALQTIPVSDSEGRLEELARRMAWRRSASQPAAVVRPFDPKSISTVVTECDRLAAHPDDPHRIAPGRERPTIDLPKAIAACEAAVRADPSNPRLNYQLGRVLGYSGRGREAIPYRAAAVAGEYPQALFVIGYITLFAMNEQPKDVCRAGELLRKSAQQQRLAGQLGFPRYVLQGLFDQCDNVRKDKAELLGFVAAARGQIKGDYYQGLLADTLEQDLKARP
jgi:tetratricopeptide (TPR) repeat protein